MSYSHVYAKKSTGSMLFNKMQSSFMKRQKAQVNLTLKSYATASSTLICENCSYCDKCQFVENNKESVPNSWLDNSNILSSTRISRDDELLSVAKVNRDLDECGSSHKKKSLSRNHLMGSDNKLSMVKQHQKLAKIKPRKNFMLPRTSSLNGNFQLKATKAIKKAASSKASRKSEHFFNNMLDSFQMPQPNSTASTSNENFNNFGDLVVWYV